jgi:hypothetical protein
MRLFAVDVLDIRGVDKVLDSEHVGRKRLEGVEFRWLHQQEFVLVDLIPLT